MDHTQIFTDIYEREYWGSNMMSYRGSSGSGSSVEFNRDYISWLRGFLQEYGYRSVVDIGCGDFRCGPAIYDGLAVDYTGFDVYEPMLESLRAQHPSRRFYVQDCFRDRRLPRADLCIMKDVLQHWTTAEIYDFMDFLVASKLYKTILIVNCSRQKKDNKDIRTGRQRQLSADYLPLKHYGAKKVFAYETKEVSLVSCYP
jgi:hypothetical protein